MNKMSNLETVRNLLYECEVYNLEGRKITRRFCLDELCKIYNGIGPDRFPEALRKALDTLHPALLPVALIHDVQYHTGGSKKDFTAANNMFKTNGKLVAGGVLTTIRHGFGHRPRRDSARCAGRLPKSNIEKSLQSFKNIMH